jgi:hypothetical protein
LIASAVATLALAIFGVMGRGQATPVAAAQEAAPAVQTLDITDGNLARAEALLAQPMPVRAAEETSPGQFNVPLT